MDRAIAVSQSPCPPRVKCTPKVLELTEMKVIEVFGECNSVFFLYTSQLSVRTPLASSLPVLYWFFLTWSRGPCNLIWWFIMYINFLSSYSHPLICIEQAQWFKSSDPMAVMKLYTCMSQIRLQSFLQGCRMRFLQVDCQYRKECYETGKHYNSDVELNSNVVYIPVHLTKR